MPRNFLLALGVASAFTIIHSSGYGQIAVGTKVLWKVQTAPLMNGNEIICSCGDLHWPCIVEKIQGSSCWIGDTKFHGWVQKDAVMTIDEAVRYHSEELRKEANLLTYINRGSALYCQGDYDLAIKDYNAAMRLAPNEGECYFNRGEAWLAKKAHKEAVADLNKAIYLYSNPRKSYEAYRLRAIAYERKGDRDASAADRRRAQQLKWSLR
jgi:tetratricopeptide (TPR) repeat protein